MAIRQFDDAMHIEMDSVVNNNGDLEVVQQPKVLRALAMVASYVLHPVFMPTVMAFVLYKLTPISFAGISDPHIMNGWGWFAWVVQNTLFYPLFVVLLLKGLGFIKSFMMENPRERIIPLIATMAFYFWLDHVMANKNPPLILRVLTLGSFWGIIVIFMINIFFKISMHTAAAGSMVGLMIVLMIISPVNMLVPFSIALVVAGISGTARMLLNAHRMSEIWVGYIVGIVVMLAAFGYLLW